MKKNRWPSLVQVMTVVFFAVAGEAQAEDNLLNTNWQAVQYNVPDQPYEPGHPATMTVMPFSISGQGGCNSYAAEAQWSEDGRVEIGNIISTKMYCADAQKEEDDFFSLLGQSSAYALSNDGSTLTLSNVKQNTVVFGKQQGKGTAR